MSWKTKNCYAEDVWKTSSRNVLKTSSKCFEDRQLFVGHNCGVSNDNFQAMVILTHHFIVSIADFEHGFVHRVSYIRKYVHCDQKIPIWPIELLLKWQERYSEVQVLIALLRYLRYLQFHTLYEIWSHTLSDKYLIRCNLCANSTLCCTKNLTSKHRLWEGDLNINKSFIISDAISIFTLEVSTASTCNILLWIY